jgi:hypothetical protein
MSKIEVADADEQPGEEDGDCEPSGPTRPECGNRGRKPNHEAKEGH